MEEQLNNAEWTKKSYGKRLSIFYHKQRPLIIYHNTDTSIGRWYSVELRGGKTTKKFIKKQRLKAS